MRNFLFLILAMGWCVSCSKKTEQKVDDAIDQALTLLSSEKCADAIKLLEDVGRQPKDPIYLQVLASAYACRAGFRAVDFIATDVPAILPANLMKSLSQLSLSDESDTDSDAYTDLNEALSILQVTDGQLNRAAEYGTRKAGDIGIQILLLSFVQLGKYLNHYGNVDITTGVKGSKDPAANSCFINYTHPSAQALINPADTGACTTFNDGHVSMTGAEFKRRLCEGTTLVANIIDVIKNVDLSVSSELSNLEGVTATVDQYRVDAQAVGVDHFIDLTSQADCETLLNSATEMNNMQTYFAALFESQLK